MRSTQYFLVLAALIHAAVAFSPSVVGRSSTIAGTRQSTELRMDFLQSILGGGEQSPKTVFEIPAKEVKVGALKFLLQISLVGIANKPEQGTWFLKQNELDGIDLYFKDGTAMLSLGLSEYMIRAERHGSKPSLQYQLQESVMLHSVLDELEKTAFGVEDIEEEKRLLRLKDDTLLEAARDKLPARAEPVS